MGVARRNYMASVTCDIPTSFLAELKRRTSTSGSSVSSLVSEALAGYLDAPLHTLFQVSTSGSLVQGVYAQAVTCAKLLEHGDFGLGTFTGLDGEMVVLDGVIYRVQGNGTVSRAAPDAGAPFAVVTQFSPSVDGPVEPVASLKKLECLCDERRRSDNLFYAFRLDGVFGHVRTRAVSPPPEGGHLLDAAKSQQEFDFHDATGTLVGIYSPDFSGAFSIPGYHFHFISDDRTQGGHVLDVAAASLRLQAEELSAFHLALPETETFLRADLSHDASADLKQAEGG